MVCDPIIITGQIMQFLFSGREMEIIIHANAKNDCVFRDLVNIGLPAGVTVGVSSSGVNTALKNWVLNNWPTNVALMLKMMSWHEKLTEGGKITIGVNGSSNLRHARAIAAAIKDSMFVMTQLKSQLTPVKDETFENTIDEPGFHENPVKDEGLTIAGTKPPDFNNNTLHLLSYAERQELVRKSMDRLEEVKPEAKE